jgi:hypothetical protein
MFASRMILSARAANPLRVAAGTARIMDQTGEENVEQESLSA